MKKSIYPILAIVLLALIIASSTYAYLNWAGDNSQKTNVVFTITSQFSCAVNGNATITTEGVELRPVNCASSPQYVIKKAININNIINESDKTIYEDLWLNIDYIDSELTQSDTLKYVLSTSNAGCNQGTILASGNFLNKTTNSKLYLLDGKKYTQGVDLLSNTYYLYIWLDIKETDVSTANKRFSLSLAGECSETHHFANAPDLYQYSTGGHTYGLVPIYYDLGTDNNPQTKVMTANPNTDTWYSYSKPSQNWANAILVKESDGTHTREYYQTNYNVEVDQNDILAYFVWIPRYSYTIYKGTTSVTNNYAGGTQAKPGVIDIKFTSVDDPVETGSANYRSSGNGINVANWRTHPSFWWDKDSDGVREDDEELSGIWVSKFEPSYTTVNGEVYASSLPNVTSNNDNISTGFINSLKFAGGLVNIENDVGVVTYNGSSYYGLFSNIASHYMKSSEWGAVANLSYSVYGNGNKPVYLNNSFNGYTGRSMGDVVGGTKLVVSNDSYNQYGKYTWDGKTVEIGTGNIGSYISDRSLSYGASTTGNIYGIYDMVGGREELLMGYYTLGDSTYAGGNKAYFGRNNGTNSSGFTYEPETKYWDAFSNNWHNTACGGDKCYGYALSNENLNWVNSYQNFSASQPWMTRGGRGDNAIVVSGNGSGLFQIYYSKGNNSGGHVTLCKET